MSCEHSSTEMWIFLMREKPTLLTLLICSCLPLPPESLPPGFCPQLSNKTVALKSANHFQVAKSPNHFPVLTLFDFSEQFHEVDTPSFLKYLIPSLSWHHILLAFLPTHWLLLSHLCWFLFLSQPLNVHCLPLCFQTHFSSLSTHSPWWSHPVTSLNVSDKPNLHPPEC